MTEFAFELGVSTPFYTETILRAIESNLEARNFMYYANTVKRVLQGEISSAVSLPALRYILMRRPKAIYLHNDIVAMTHDDMLMRNIPKIVDNSYHLVSELYARESNSYIAQVLDLMNRFALTEGARPSDANAARCQVMRCLEIVMESQQQMTRAVGDLAAEMTSMAV